MVKSFFHKERGEMQNIFYIRSMLYVPGDKENMVKKAYSLPCDAVIFDLEDAVSPLNKKMARDMLAEKLRESKPKNLFIRINSVETGYFNKDLQVAISLGVDGIIIPKSNADAIRRAEKEMVRIEQEERKPEIKIIPLIETAFGVQYLAETLSASSRIIAAQFGAEDLTKDLGIARTREGNEIWYARNRFVYACRSLGKGAIDTPCTDIKDLDALRSDTLLAKKIGMTAKTCIHPSHIEIINSIFSPSKDEICAAKRIVAHAQLDENRGKGAFAVDGKMVDAPVLERAENILCKAKLYNLYI